MMSGIQHTYTAAAMIDPASQRINLHVARGWDRSDTPVVEVADDGACYTRALNYREIEEDEDDGRMPPTQPTVTLDHAEAEAIYSALGVVLGHRHPVTAGADADKPKTY